MQSLIDELSKGWRAERSLSQFTLKAMIDRLEGFKNQPIVFDDGRNPGTCDTYRGYYSDLALGTSPDTVCSGYLAGELKEALYSTMTGYKGGDFYMDDNTPLWAADYSKCGRKIVDIQEKDGGLIIVTVEDED